MTDVAVPEMVERVARAMYERSPITESGECIDGHQITPNVVMSWDDACEHWTDVVDDMRADARAAIEAMREPTEAQLRALLVHRRYDPDANADALDRLGQLDVMTMGVFITAYRAMIDGASMSVMVPREPTAKWATDPQPIREAHET